MSRALVVRGHASPALSRVPGWHRDALAALTLRQATGDKRCMVWRGHGLTVLSSSVEAEYRGQVGRHNHVSVAAADHDRRPSDDELARVRRDFDMADAEEDNHSPGVARHLFLPLWLPRGTTGICECKAEETEVVEPDGFRWSRPHTH
jgi:hypothetical protein